MEVTAGAFPCTRSLGDLAGSIGLPMDSMTDAKVCLFEAAPVFVVGKGSIQHGLSRREQAAVGPYTGYGDNLKEADL